MIVLADLFLRQAEACERLGSPFMQRMLTLCANRMTAGHPITDRLINWTGDATALGDAIALRFAGALHALVLQGRDAGLAKVYPPNQASDAALWQAIETAMTAHQDRIMHWLDSAPQTNEVRRSIAMISASQTLAARFPGLGFRISELGASAGLNLFFDRYALSLPDGTTRGAADPVITLTPEWRGDVPPVGDVRIEDRRGIDLNPLDPTNPQDMLRLQSYTWADQADRMQRLAAAAGIAQPVVDKGDAAAWLADRLAQPTLGMINLVFHTIAWQYFPPATDAALHQTLAQAGAKATPDAPLAHLWVEADNTGPGAEIRLTIWYGSDQAAVINIGRMNPHGLNIEINTFGAPDF